MKHHAAVRALAYKWMRIIFRLWKTKTIYDENQYIQRLRIARTITVAFHDRDNSDASRLSCIATGSRECGFR